MTAIPGSENDDRFWADRNEHDKPSRAIIFPSALPQHTQVLSRVRAGNYTPRASPGGSVALGISPDKWPAGLGQGRTCSTTATLQVSPSSAPGCFCWCKMTPEVTWGRQSSQKSLVLENEIENSLTWDQPMGNMRHWKSKAHVRKLNLAWPSCFSSVYLTYRCYLWLSWELITLEIWLQGTCPRQAAIQDCSRYRSFSSSAFPRPCLKLSLNLWFL